MILRFPLLSESRYGMNTNLSTSRLWGNWQDFCSICVEIRQTLNWPKKSLKEKMEADFTVCSNVTESGWCNIDVRS